MEFGVKVTNKVTGEVIWINLLEDFREMIMQYGSLDEYVKSLRLQDEYPEEQYSICLSPKPKPSRSSLQ